MSVSVARELWDSAPLSKNHLLVAIALADYANGDRQAWPSVTKLADRCRCSPDSVRRALAAMEDTKVITRHERAGRSTVYEFNAVDIWADPSRKCEGSGYPNPSGNCEGSDPPDPSGNCDPSQSATPRTGAADPSRNCDPHPSHRCDPHFVEPPVEPPGTTNFVADAVDDPDDELATADPTDTPTVPLAAATGQTYSNTLAAWAVTHGHPEPDDDPTRADVTRWLLRVLHRELPVDDDTDRTRARGRAIALLGDYLTAVDKPLSREAWSLLGRHVKGHSSTRVLDALEIAVNKGAGLLPEYEGDPLALLKFAATVLNPRKDPS